MYPMLYDGVEIETEIDENGKTRCIAWNGKGRSFIITDPEIEHALKIADGTRPLDNLSTETMEELKNLKFLRTSRFVKVDGMLRFTLLPIGDRASKHQLLCKRLKSKRLRRKFSKSSAGIVATVLVIFVWVSDIFYTIFFILAILSTIFTIGLCLII